MAQVSVQTASVYEGYAYETATEDGRAVVWDCYAAVTGIDGAEYLHLVPFRSWHECERLVRRIEGAGVINTDHWVKQEPRMSLEDRFALYAERENEVRHGLRSEDDMYHGVP